MKRITNNGKFWQTIKLNFTNKTFKNERITLVGRGKIITEKKKGVVKNFNDHFQKQPPECSVKKAALKNLANLTGKHLCQSLFFDKVAGLRPANLLKKRLWHRCFPVKFAKILRTHFLQNTSWQLLLHFGKILETFKIDRLILSDLSADLNDLNAESNVIVNFSHHASVP